MKDKIIRFIASHKWLYIIFAATMYYLIFTDDERKDFDARAEYLQKKRPS